MSLAYFTRLSLIHGFDTPPNGLFKQTDRLDLDLYQPYVVRQNYT